MTTDMHSIKKFEVSDVFALLAGSWEFKRSISGHGNMQGMATFTEDGADILNYKETGIVELINEKKCMAYREYQYRYQDRTIAVFFKDNGNVDRLFHLLKFAWEGAGLKATARHICKKDIYDTTYHFNDRNRFSLVHHVKGPLKDYISDTNFWRK